MANANPQDNEIEVITKLKTFANSNPNSRLCFTFYPNSASSYGIDSQWQAAFTNAGMATTDYDLTLEQAAERLLDRLLHPEKYVDDVD